MWPQIQPNSAPLLPCKSQHASRPAHCETGGAYLEVGHFHPGHCSPETVSTHHKFCRRSLAEVPITAEPVMQSTPSLSLEKGRSYSRSGGLRCIQPGAVTLLSVGFLPMNSSELERRSHHRPFHAGGSAGGAHHLRVQQPAVQIRPGDLRHLGTHSAPGPQQRAVAAALSAVRRAAHPQRGGRPRHRPRPHHLH